MKIYYRDVENYRYYVKCRLKKTAQKILNATAKNVMMSYNDRFYFLEEKVYCRHLRSPMNGAEFYELGHEEDLV